MDSSDPTVKAAEKAPTGSSGGGEIKPKPDAPKAASPAPAQQVANIEREMTSFERSTLRWAKTAVVMSGLAAIFVCLQWWEMHTSGTDTHNLAAASGNQATWTQHLADSTKTQADRTKDLADRMKDQADRTKDLAEQAKIQAQEAKIAADAARSAAQTANEGLHVAQRAYLAVNDPQFDFASGNVTFSIENLGRIPSGTVDMQLFEEDLANPNLANSGQFRVTERHWAQSHLDTIPPGLLRTHYISIPDATSDGVTSGHQMIRFGGIISYGDGFSDTPKRVEKFCYASVRDSKSKRLVLAVCDQNEGIDKLVKSVGYPQNEEHPN
jgi:hypothetical protein